ncbi:hypothetical protein L3073_15740 [Ancylomarina sp. DW003]|nr:hypothetical protein [Ancylomarina sp. DW003]MDE5423671.1 hypothetical protein [Ancylomarina sp. DW003]
MCLEKKGLMAMGLISEPLTSAKLRADELFKIALAIELDPGDKFKEIL